MLNKVDISESRAYILCSIGNLYIELDASYAAQDAYNRSRKITQQLEDSFLFFYLHLSEATLVRLQGNLIRARSLLDTAMEVAQKVIPITSEDYIKWRPGDWP